MQGIYIKCNGEGNNLGRKRSSSPLALISSITSVEREAQHSPPSRDIAGLVVSGSSSPLLRRAPWNKKENVSIFSLYSFSNVAPVSTVSILSDLHDDDPKVFN